MHSLFREEDPCYFFLDFFLHIYGLRFPIACSSHVRPRGLNLPELGTN